MKRTEKSKPGEFHFEGSQRGLKQKQKGARQTTNTIEKRMRKTKNM